MRRMSYFASSLEMCRAYMIHMATSIVVNMNPNMSRSKFEPMRWRMSSAMRLCKLLLSTAIAKMSEPTKTMFGSCKYGLQASSVDSNRSRGRRKTGMRAVTGTGTASVDQ